MGFHGVVMLDVSDPRQATEIGRLPADTLLSGSFHAIGNVGMLSNAGMSLTRMYDLSDPRSPMPIPGGEWHTTDPESGNPIPYYFANMGGRYALFARKGDGGGPMVVDISDPVQPRFVDHLHQPDAAGGYIFRHEDYLFQGEGDYGALYSFVEGEPIAELGRFALPGDLDTVTPVGNIAVVSVDHGAQDGISSVVVPWTEAVDDRGPRVELTFPRDEELYVAPTSAVGFVFDEAVNDASVFPGSVRVTDRRGRVISSRTYVQENIVNVVPDAPWEEAQTYTVTLPAGGVADVSGNALEADVTVVFSTDDRIR